MCVLYAVFWAAVGGIAARIFLYIGVGILQIFTGWERETCDTIINIGTAIFAIFGGVEGFFSGLEKDHEIKERHDRLQVERNHIKNLRAQRKQTSNPRAREAIKSEINSAQCRMMDIKSEYDHSDSSWDSSSSESQDSSNRYQRISGSNYSTTGYIDKNTGNVYSTDGRVMYRYDEKNNNIYDANYQKVGFYEPDTQKIYDANYHRVGEIDNNTGTIYDENYHRAGEIEQ